MLEMRKFPRRSMSMQDRIIKSDAEDKSLSNDETPPPTCPRQPPDGVETPSDAVEKVPEPASRGVRLPAGWPITRSRYSYSSRTQDARSEASVKDKIAMFSNDHATSTDRLDKCGTLPTRNNLGARKSTNTYTSSYSDISSLDRRLTKSQDNLDEVPRSYIRHVDRPSILGAPETPIVAPPYGAVANNNRALNTDNKPLFYGSTTTLPLSTETSFAPAIYHARSVSDDNGKNKSTSTHKSNLEYLIEQRKKAMSKLRGLAIPEVQAPIVDLPEIKVQDSLSKTFLLKPSQPISNSKNNIPNNPKPMKLNETAWKAPIFPNNIPKYSPAFKRKSLQVYTPSSLSKESTPERLFNERAESFNKISDKTSKPRAFYESNDIRGRMTSTLNPKILTRNNSTNIPKKDYKDILNYVRDYQNVEIKICTTTDIIDSDNDSAMSSTQSSYRSSASSPMHTIENGESDSSRLSPRISHYATYSVVKTETPIKKISTEKRSDEYVKRNVCRSVSSDTNVSLSSSAGSAATSGSQASCSSLESSVADSDKRKVSKTYDIDTINRRNILASAKCRSGRDAKLKSPVIETKFSHESCDRPASPVLKTSERLSTLTPSVSAISNKGENRRRNKIIAETDSDSDTDVNIRQRKSDFKNTRLKRNSSSSNKNKQGETSPESPKSEDAPKLISEKIIKEIKKAGLESFVGSKPVILPDKNGYEIKKTDTVMLKKDDMFVKASEVKHIHKSETSYPKKMTEEKPAVEPGKPISKLSKRNELKSDKTQNSVTTDVEIPTRIIRLKRGVGTGVGVILAGGIDCEAKDVTVHRILADSIAAKAGLKRGAKVRSINGHTMTGLTHAQSVTILKDQRSEVVIEIESETQENAVKVGNGSEKAESKDRHEADKGAVAGDKASAGIVTVLLEKAGGGAGLGFGLDGGRDSPRGDHPLTIKKLFAGGAAVQSGRVLVGAELLSAGGQSMESFTRTQAWAALKALPAGPVRLVLRNP